MSIVSPVTVAWQRVTNENTGEAKEIETFDELKPAIQRAEEVIFEAKDSQTPDFTGSDPEAHLTLHPGDFKYKDALAGQSLDNVYITLLPGAITQDATETFPSDSASNVADLNTFASRVFFAETGGEFIFDSDVTVRGDFSFTGNVLTFKLDGDIEAGFRVEDVNSNISSFITYNIADEEWTIGDSARVQGKLLANRLQLKNGTSVNNIKTKTEDFSDSANALVTESAILDAIQDGGINVSGNKKFDRADFDGNQVKTKFDIQHGLDKAPTSWQVFPASDDASSFSHATADDSKIRVFYDSAPPNGNQNVKLNWRISDGGSGPNKEEGQISFDGDGSKTQFQIPHGLSSRPSSWQVTPNSDEASLISNVSADANNLIVNFDSAPPAGSQNLKFTWEAIEDQSSTSGQFTSSGDGSTKQFQISHGLGEIPATWQIEAVSPDSTQPSHATADSNYITVFYDSPPPSGTNNLVLNWSAREKDDSTTTDVVNSIQGGTDISLSGTTGDVVVSHSNTGGAQTNSDSTTYLNQIVLDGRGHVEAVGFDEAVSANTGISEDGNEVLSSTEDINFVASNDANVDVKDDGDGTATVDIDVASFNSDNYVETSGDTMNGPLTINDSLSVSQDISVGGNTVGTNSFRDLFVDSGAPSDSEGEDGDVWFETGTEIVESIVTGGGIFADQQTGDVTISHGITSGVSDSTDASTAITGLTFDDYGHVQTLSTGEIGVGVEDSSASVQSNASTIDFSTGLDVTDEGGGKVSIETIPGVDVEDDGTVVASSVPNINFGSNIGASDDGDGTVTVDLSGNLGIEIEDDGTTVESGANNINFSAGIDVTGDGDGSVTTDVDLSEFTTNDLPEGSSNLYFTEARVDQRLQEIRPANQDTFNGDGQTTEFSIYHGLPAEPQSWHVTPATDDASNVSHVTADDNNLYVKYNTPPPSGTSNVVINWFASGTGTTASPTFQNSQDLSYDIGASGGGGSISNNPPYFENKQDVQVIKNEPPQWEDREDLIAYNF